MHMLTISSTYLFPASFLERLFLFKETADTCRILHEVAFHALEVYLKAGGFLHLTIQLSL